VHPQTISLISFIIISFIVLAIAVIVLWKIWINDISLNGLLAEIPPAGGKVADAKASLSRFQMLIFTFVIAGLFMMLSIEAGGFVDIPQNVLLLLGISGGTYVVSKGVSKSGTKPQSCDDDKSKSS
jgi:hypothetical protein